MKPAGRPGPNLHTKRAVAIVAALGATLVAAFSDAQDVDPRRPAVFASGAPRGASPMARVDAQRRGRAQSLLPIGPLELAWRRPLGLALEQSALALEGGRIAVVASRGDVVLLDAAGEERGHATIPGGVAGPATATSDGTVVFATSAGEAVGVETDGRVRYAARVLGDRSVFGAPLPLDDGGVILATPAELVVLDARGNVRTRASLPEPPGAPLLSAGNQVLVVSNTGIVYGYVPGAAPLRVGSFGGPVDGAAALLEGGVLTGVVAGELVDVDLGRGGLRTTRVAVAEGLLLGPVASFPKGGPRAVALLHLVSVWTSVVAFDAAGGELVRAPLGIPVAGGSAAGPKLPDGGAPPLVVGSHVGPVTDGRGAIAFATADGIVGVVAPDGRASTLSTPPCSRVGRSAGVAGLTPAGDGAFLVTCEAGLVALVRGAGSPMGPHALDAGSGREPGSRL